MTEIVNKCSFKVSFFFWGNEQTCQLYMYEQMHVFEKIKLRSHDYHNHKYLVDNIAILPFYLISFPDRVHYEYKKKSFLN